MQVSKLIIKKLIFGGLLAVAILAGSFGFSEKGFAYYNPSGILQSANLLAGTSGAAQVTGFVCNVSALPAGATLQIRFSADGFRWYNAARIYGWTPLSSGTNTIDLSSFLWPGNFFEYQIYATSDGTASPVLSSATLNYVSYDPNNGVYTAYSASGTLDSTNLLLGISKILSISSFSANVASLPAGTGAKIQFSQDDSTWCDSSNHCDGAHYNVLSSGLNTVDLSDLNWSGSNFYYKLSFSSNSGGNVAPVLNSIAVNYSQDTTPPVTYADATPYNFGDWTNSNVTVSLICADAESGCGTTYWCDDSPTCTDYAPYVTPFTVSAEGTTHVRYYSVDALGNSETPNSQVIHIDKTGPSVSAGNDQTKNAQFTQTGSVTAGASPIASKLWTMVSGPGTITFSTPTQTSTTVSADTDGAYVIRITATDAAGNSHSASFNLTWDTTGPILTEIAPITTPSTNTTPTYAFNSNKAGNITYQGSCSSTTTTATSGSNQITFNALTPATYSDCKIIVTDSLGNVSLPLTVSSFTITVPFSGSGGGAGLMLYQKQNVVSQVVNQITSVTQQISGLFGNNQETLVPPVNYPPIAKAVPEKPQPVFQNNWQVLPVASSPNLSFVNNATPVNIKDLAGKFPQINNTFKALGMGNVIDLKKIANATFILPTLSGAINSKLMNGNAVLPGIALNNLSAAAKAVIPTDIVFARTPDQKIDYGMNLSVDKSGNVQQKMETVVNKNIELVVKPEKPVASINGYIVLIKTDASPIGKSKYVNYFSASLTGANSGATVSNQNSQGTVVSQFHYDSANGDNIYTGQIETPPVEGTYKIVTVLNYKDPKITAKEIDMTLLVDPEGYVYVQSAEGETRIAGVKISIYWQDPKTNTYELWPAKDYSQYNPQVTDVTGKYSFLVPPGNYYMTAEKKGYDFYKTGNFTVQAGSAVNQDILIKKTSFNLWSWFVSLF